MSSEENNEKFRVVDGRKYHNVATANYPLPHDKGEVERLTLQHSIFKHFLGGNYKAPVANLLNAGGATVLDVGCGPGAWTLDMAQEFPQSNFYGIDLSPEFTKTSAPNVKFIEGNILDGLPYPDATFDFVFSRLLVAAFTAEQWQKVYIPELLRVTKPGGWIEFFETSFEQETIGSPSYVRLQEGLTKFAIEKGMDTNLSENFPTMLNATGELTDITSQVYNVPLGSKHGKWGEAFLRDMVEVYQSLTPMIAKALKTTPEDIRALIDAVAIEGRTTESFWVSTQAYARKKPLENVTQ